MKLVLLGYMGSGKSSVGKLLSETLQFEFTDLDQYIEMAENRSISQLFQEKGEIYFRRNEATALTRIISEKNKMVIATGGGTPCYGTVMTDLLAHKDVVTIYLKNSLDTLTQRLFGEKNERPLIAHLETEALLNDFIRKHLFERSYYYNQASIVLPCDGLSPETIVENLILKLF
ncbi:MAG: shikimate kinase [Bacteroidota bacterium]